MIGQEIKCLARWRANLTPSPPNPRPPRPGNKSIFLSRLGVSLGIIAVLAALTYFYVEEQQRPAKALAKIEQDAADAQERMRRANEIEFAKMHSDNKKAEERSNASAKVMHDYLATLGRQLDTEAESLKKEMPRVKKEYENALKDLEKLISEKLREAEHIVDSTTQAIDRSKEFVADTALTLKSKQLQDTLDSRDADIKRAGHFQGTLKDLEARMAAKYNEANTAKTPEERNAAYNEAHDLANTDISRLEELADAYTKAAESLDANAADKAKKAREALDDYVTRIKAFEAARQVALEAERAKAQEAVKTLQSSMTAIGNFKLDVIDALSGPGAKKAVEELVAKLKQEMAGVKETRGVP